MNIKLKNYIGNVEELTISLTGNYMVDQSVLNGGKSFRLKMENGQIALYHEAEKIKEDTTITFIPVEYNLNHQLSINGRPYIGKIQFVQEGSSIRPINSLPIEDYLKGVVPYEVSPSWGMDALKVQAVAARTYAASHINQIINDTISYQVYAGYNWHPRTTEAVNETKGQILTYQEKPIYAFYSSSNGGQTEANGNVWGGTNLPYLPIKKDIYDPGLPWSFTVHKMQIDLSNKDLSHPESWWMTTVEADSIITSNIKEWLARNGYENCEIKIVSIPALNFTEQRTTGGRVTTGEIKVQFFVKNLSNNEFYRNDDGSLQIHSLDLKTSAERIRSIIGINLVRSYLIDRVVETENSFTISGHGFGHGVGMSQWGTKRMSELGFNHHEILEYYYPGTRLTNAQSVGSVQETRTPKQIRLKIDKTNAVANGQEIQLSVAPFINNGRTLIPLRFVSEQLGGTVHWNQKTREITIRDAQHIMILTPGSTEVHVNGKNIAIDVEPIIIRGTTFVPLRFISEQLGASVYWNSIQRSIYIEKS